MADNFFRPSPISSPLIKLRTSHARSFDDEAPNTKSSSLSPPATANTRRTSAAPLDISRPVNERSSLRDSSEMQSESLEAGRVRRRSKLMQGIRKLSHSTIGTESAGVKESASIQAPSMDTEKKKKKGFFKRIFGGTKKKEVTPPPSNVEGSSYSSREPERAASYTPEQSRHSSRSSSIRSLFHLPRSRQQELSPNLPASYYSGHTESEDAGSQISFMPLDYQSTQLGEEEIPQKKKKRGLLKKMFGSSKKSSKPPSDRPAEPSRPSVSFIQESPSLQPSTQAISFDQVPPPSSTADPYAEKKKKKGGWGLFKKSKKSQQQSIPTSEPPGDVDVNLGTPSPEPIVEPVVKIEISEELIKKEELVRLNRLHDETREDFLDCLRDIQKRFFIRQGKHCLWKYQKLRALLSKEYNGELPPDDKIYNAENSALDEYMDRKHLREHREMKEETDQLLVSSKILMQVAQTGKIQDLKRVDWRAINLQEQVESMKIAFSIQQVTQLIHCVFDNQHFQESLKTMLTKTEDQIESWVQSGVIEQLQHGLDISPSDVKRLGQLRQGQLLLTHMDTLLSLAAKNAHETYYRDMENLAVEIESMRTKINQLIDESFEYLKLQLIPPTTAFMTNESTRYTPRFPIDHQEEHFVMPPFISRKLKLSPTSSSIVAIPNPSIEDKTFMLRRLTQRANLPVGEGFTLTSSRADLEAMESKLRGKWGSYNLFERWLHDAMRWQWQDVCSQNTLKESRIHLENSIQDKKTYMKENVDKRLTQLWTGRATAAKEEAVDRLYRYLVEAVSQRPPILVASTQQESERMAMSYEDNHSQIMRVLEGPVGRELLRRNGKKSKLTVSSKNDVDTIITMARDIRLALDTDQTMMRDVELQTLLEDIKLEIDHVWKQVEQVVQTRQNKEYNHERRKDEYDDELITAKQMLEEEKIKLSKIDELSLNDKEEELDELKSQLESVKQQILTLAESKKNNKARLKEVEKEIKINKKKLQEEQRKLKVLSKSANLSSTQLSAQEYKNTLIVSDLKSPSSDIQQSLSDLHVPLNVHSSEIRSPSSVEDDGERKKKKKWFSVIGGSSKPSKQSYEIHSEESPPRPTEPATRAFSEEIEPENIQSGSAEPAVVDFGIVEAANVDVEDAAELEALRLSAMDIDVMPSRRVVRASSFDEPSSKQHKKGIWKKLGGKSKTKETRKATTLERKPAMIDRKISDPLGAKLAESDQTKSKSKGKKWGWLGGKKSKRKEGDNKSDGGWSNSESASWIQSRRTTVEHDDPLEAALSKGPQRFSIVTRESDGPPITVPPTDTSPRFGESDEPQMLDDSEQPQMLPKRLESQIPPMSEESQMLPRPEDCQAPIEAPLSFQKDVVIKLTTPDAEKPQRIIARTHTPPIELELAPQSSVSWSEDATATPVAIGSPTLPGILGQLPGLDEIAGQDDLEVMSFAPRAYQDDGSQEPSPSVESAMPVVRSLEDIGGQRRLQSSSDESEVFDLNIGTTPEHFSSDDSPQPILPSPTEKHEPLSAFERPRKPSSSMSGISLAKRSQNVSWHQSEVSTGKSKKKNPVMGWATKLLQPGKKRDRRMSATPIMTGFVEEPKPLQTQRSAGSDVGGPTAFQRGRCRRPSASTRILFRSDFGDTATPELSDILLRWNLTCLMSEEEIEILSREASLVQYDSGDNVCELGEKLDYVLLVKSGRLEGLDYEGSVAEIYRSCDFVFDIEEGRASLTVHAVEDCEIWHIDMSLLKRLTHDSQTRVSAQLLDRIREIEAFKSLSYQETSELVRHLRPRILHQMPDSCESFWVVWKGAMLATSLKDERTEQYHPKDIYGLENFLNERPAGPVNLTAQQSPTVLFEIRGSLVESIIGTPLYEFCRRAEPQDLGQMESVSVVGGKRKKKGIPKVFGASAKLLGMKKKKKDGSEDRKSI